MPEDYQRPLMECSGGGGGGLVYRPIINYKFAQKSDLER